MLRSEARAIVKEYQQRIPVDVKSLAQDLGATVRYVYGWPDDTSGVIRVDGRNGGSGGYSIQVNGDHHPNRQRFTIAHEIAHIVLHKHLIGEGITTNGLYRSGLSNTVEWAANRAAGNILMPRAKIKELLDQGVESVDELAIRFGVSRSAMSIQLDWTWALEWELPSSDQ